MALPSARRPPAAAKLLEEEKTQSLKLKFRKEDILMNSVGGWAKARKNRNDPLTRKMMERRAVFEAYRLNIPHDKLPKDWLPIVVKRYGLTLYKRKKRMPRSFQGGNTINGTAVKNINGFNNSSSDSDIGTEFGEPQSESAPETTLTKRRLKKNPKERKPLKKPKKIIDLSNEPPPGWWLQSFAKGVILPRELRVYSDADQTIIFYDYEDDGRTEANPALKGYAPVLHDRILKFDWWKEETKKKDAADPSRIERSSVYFASPEKDD